MASRRNRHLLVVDANILRSASESGPAGSQQSMCEEFLRSIQAICHSVVVTEEIEHEWSFHRSRWALRWRTAMENRSKIQFLSVSEDTALRSVIKAAVSNQSVAQELEKDACLLEACRQGDLIVASADNEARRGFARCAADIGWLARVIWVNPATDPSLVDWLERGANHEEPRSLLAYNRTQAQPSSHNPSQH